MKLNKGQLVSAAVAGILGAALVSHSAMAADTAAGGEKKGHCVGANACKGKGACATKGANDCAGKNACKGKGFMEMSKAQCDSMMKKDKKIKFEG